MKKIAAPISLAFLAVLSGCATMSADECATADWSSVGYEDGVQGYPADRLGDHRKACAKHGYTPDLVAYRQGREQGLVEYCRPGSGFRAGESGANYHGVCPADSEEDFLSGYRIGHHLYELRSAVSKKSADIDWNLREIKKLEKKMREKEDSLTDDELSSAERRDLLDDIKQMSERIGRLDEENDRLMEERTVLRVELSQFEDTLPVFRD